MRSAWPRGRPALRYGVSLTFARAIGEFGAVLVVSGSVSGLTETSTLFIYRSLDEREEVSAYTMALVLLSFLLLTCIKTFRRAQSAR